MKRKHLFDIFISYRRAGGQETALLLYERLTARGYRVAYDIETLRSGRFDEQLLQNVEGCRDLVAVLGPGSLDRCIAWEAAQKSQGGKADEDSDDWMRREIARAMHAGVNVIPVLLRGFSFPRPEALPADIRTMPLLNGVEASTMHFNDTLSHIEAKLRARPRWHHRPLAWLGVMAGAVAIAAAIACIADFSANGRRSYPSTRQEEQQMEDYLSVLERHGPVYGEALSQMADLAAEASAALNVGDSRSFSVFVHEYSSHLLSLQDRAHRIRLSDQAASTLRSSPLSVSGLETLLAECENNIRDARSRLPARFTEILDGKNPLSPADKAKIIRWAQESVQLGAEGYALEVMRLLLPVDAAALTVFQDKASSWPILSEQFKGEWQREPALIERARKSVEARGRELDRKVVEFTGGMAIDTAGKQRELEGKLQDMGAAKEDAERISGKVAHIGAMKAEIADTKILVDAKRSDVYVNHRATPDDDPATLWGKALRFRTVKLPEGALEALALLREKHSPEHPEAAIDALEAIVRLDGDEPPAQGGIVVFGFEPPATNHAVFLVGDVIVERGGTPVRWFNDYATNRASDCVFYRLDATGAFRRHEATIPEGQPRTGLYETVEEISPTRSDSPASML